MLLKSSFKYTLGRFLCKLLKGKDSGDFFLYDSKGCDCSVKLVLLYEDKVLLAKESSCESLSKVCLPYGEVNLQEGEDNSAACERISFERLNVALDSMFFDSSSILNVEMIHEKDSPELVYVYKYNLAKEEFEKISDSYIFYDFFLFDLKDLEEYKEKRRFVSKYDYLILKGMELENDKNN